LVGSHQKHSFCVGGGSPNVGLYRHHLLSFISAPTKISAIEICRLATAVFVFCAEFVFPV